MLDGSRQLTVSVKILVECNTHSQHLHQPPLHTHELAGVFERVGGLGGQGPGSGRYLGIRHVRSEIFHSNQRELERIYAYYSGLLECCCSQARFLKEPTLSNSVAP